MRYRDEAIARYVCPRTHEPLRLEGEVLRADSGRRAYPIKTGIPHFLRFNPAEDGEASEKLDRLNRLAREKGWKTALQLVYGEDKHLLRYVSDPQRASFIDLLPVTLDSDVLEIGPGLGQFTARLAQRARCVYALEVVSGQAEFTAERCRQESTSNVHVAAGGDDCRFPYASQSFDLAVLSLVFEWCASRCADEAMESVQRRLLSEVHRVLKPGGSAYLATKNRFALRFLIGKRDEHCYDVRFGSALPRPITNFLVHLKGHVRPLGMLHSYSALQSMLRDAGFGRIDSYWAAPDIRFPMHYVPADAASIRQARLGAGFIQGESLSTRLLMPLIPPHLVKHFTPGLTFLATKRRSGA